MIIRMAQQGWQCPNCGNILSPNTMWCPFCSGEKKLTHTTTTTTDHKTETLKISDYCDTCKQDMCKDCIADATNPYCVPSHYEVKQDRATDRKRGRVMTLKQNITTILECYFSGFKDELIEACVQRIMEQIERQANTPQTNVKEGKE